jgi:hypothetical protein
MAYLFPASNTQPLIYETANAKMVKPNESYFVKSSDTSHMNRNLYQVKITMNGQKRSA